MIVTRKMLIDTDKTRHCLSNSKHTVWVCLYELEFNAEHTAKYLHKKITNSNQLNRRPNKRGYTAT